MELLPTGNGKIMNIVKNQKVFLSLLGLIIVLLLGGNMLISYTAPLKTSEFELTSMMVTESSINVSGRVLNNQEGVYGFNFDTLGNTVEIRPIVRPFNFMVQKKLSAQTLIWFDDGIIQNIDTVVMKYADQGVIVWQKDQ